MTTIIVIARDTDTKNRVAAALTGLAKLDHCPDCKSGLVRRMDAGGTWEDCPVCGFSRLTPRNNRLAQIGRWEEQLDAMEAHDEATL